jgi:signal transduction histidine kinase
MESIGRLAGGVAHDFNNLLTVILSCAEILRDGASAVAPAQRELVEEIHTAGVRAAGLTHQLLAFARKEPIAPIPLDLNAVVRGSETLLRRTLGMDIQLVVNLQDGLWRVTCDPGQIEQVILNLAINARDAMPAGGELAITTSNARSDDALVARIPFLLSGEYVRLVVRDNGEGMSPEVKAHAFEPFFTTKPAGKGTGLGLAMVYGIVKQAGGQVVLESEAGRGTAFEIFLPRAE